VARTWERVFKPCIIAGVEWRSIKTLWRVRLVAAELLAYKTWVGKGFSYRTCLTKPYHGGTRGRIGGRA
jgi:hypothetical protein